jgi:stage V sporulation protein R
MATSRLLIGSSLLQGNNTIPGAIMPKKFKGLLPDIFKAVSEFGCDYYPAVVEMLQDDELSEIVAYNGFPVRYPHWQFGMRYQELQSSYEWGKGKIYEIVINTNPCYIYCLNSNTLVENIVVVAHALGHSDFFKNNIHFKRTDTNMMNKLANNGMRIRKYIDRWGKETVTEFIDYVLRLDNLIDWIRDWQNPKRSFKDERHYYHPRKLYVDPDRRYMDRWINTEKWMKKEKERIKKIEAAEQLEIFPGPTKDILGFLRDNAPLKPWQADIVAMLHEESKYFAPQGRTKMLNEGFASWIDYKIMAEGGLASLGQDHPSCGAIEFAKMKMGAMGGKYSSNPYKLGFYLLRDIEERWDKGRFGVGWEECDNMHEREKWDKELGLGK